MSIMFTASFSSGGIRNLCQGYRRSHGIAIRENCFRGTAARCERPVQRRVFPVVAAGVQPRREAYRLRSEAADGVGGERPRDPIGTEVTPLTRSRPEPAAQLAAHRIEIG